MLPDKNRIAKMKSLPSFGNAFFGKNDATSFLKSRICEEFSNPTYSIVLNQNMSFDKKRQ